MRAPLYITSSCECSTYAPKTSRDEILGFPKAVRFARQVLLLAVTTEEGKALAMHEVQLERSSPRPHLKANSTGDGVMAIAP